MYQQSRKRNDSIDSRSHSFDSTENEKTKPIKIKIKKSRTRDQYLVPIQPSPIPENFRDLMIFQNKK